VERKRSASKNCKIVTSGSCNLLPPWQEEEGCGGIGRYDNCPSASSNLSDLSSNFAHSSSKLFDLSSNFADVSSNLSDYKRPVGSSFGTLKQQNSTGNSRVRCVQSPRSNPSTNSSASTRSSTERTGANGPIRAVPKSTTNSRISITGTARSETHAPREGERHDTRL